MQSIKGHSQMHPYGLRFTEDKSNISVQPKIGTGLEYDELNDYTTIYEKGQRIPFVQSVEPFVNTVTITEIQETPQDDEKKLITTTVTETKAHESPDEDRYGSW